MQPSPVVGAISPVLGLVLWFGIVIGSFGAAAFVLRLIVRAVRALEQRSHVSTEVLLLNARVDEQARELAALRSEVRRLDGGRSPSHARET